MKRRIVFDTETTGLLKPDNAPLGEQPFITEIYCVAVDEEFNMLGEFHSLIKPPMPIPKEITEITGITDEMVANSPPFSGIINPLAAFFMGAEDLIAHNVSFDRGMLANELRRLDRQFRFPWPPNHICTVEMSMPLKGARLPLGRLHQLLIGSAHVGAHRAKEDTFAVVRCLHAMEDKAK